MSCGNHGHKIESFLRDVKNMQSLIIEDVYKFAKK